MLPFLFLLVMGVALPAMTLAVYYDDTVQAIPLATAALFYISPVFYHVGLVPEALLPYYMLNPLVWILNAYHTVLYTGAIPPTSTLLATAGLTTALAMLGFMIFNRKKREFAEIV